MTTYDNGAGNASPHQAESTSVSVNGGTPTTSPYTYDAAGRTRTRGTGTTATQLTWDPESELARSTTNGATTSFVYTADGDRLTGTDPSGTTVYLPGGQEIQITSTAVKATRYYSFAGQIVAVRTGKGLGGVTSLVNDAHGTPVAAIPNKEQPNLNPVDRFYTDPFGATRGTSGAGTVPGDQQFLGKIRDASTGYTLLGARYYDETLGRFLTVDPILDLTDPQQWNGYAYAGNNPTTLSDPSGLYASHCATQACANSTGGANTSAQPAPVTFAEVDPPVTIAISSGPVPVPPTEEEMEQFSAEEAKRWAVVLDVIHIALGIAGLFPVAGEPFDMIDAGLCAVEGDMVCAGLGASSGIPGVGWLPAAAKIGKSADEVVEVIGTLAKSGDRLPIPSVNWGQQEKHFSGHFNYLSGRSQLTADPRRLVERAGTGTPVNAVTRGEPGFKERIDYGEEIGFYADRASGEMLETSVGILHYGKNGVHIVPARPGG